MYGTNGTSPGYPDPDPWRDLPPLSESCGRTDSPRSTRSLPDYNPRYIIFFIKIIVILADIYAAIFIENIKNDLNLFKNRDLFFESVSLDNLDVYAYIINLNISKIYIKNNTNRDIIF